MECTYEIITLDNSLPIKMIFHTSNERDFVPKHWHDSIEISYVLSRKIDKINVEGMEYSPEKGDIVLINSNAIHSFWLDQSESRKAVTILIPHDLIKTNYPDFDFIEFDCISNSASGKQKYKEIYEVRKILNSLIKAYKSTEYDNFAPIKIKSLTYELIYLLLTNFKKEKEKIGVIRTKKHLDRLTLITSFIKENYHQKLTVEMIANSFGYTPEYFSNFFKKYMGITVLSYINSIRLEKAHHELMETDKTNIEIALENGFPNEKSFIRVFKSIYQLTPNQYKREKAMGHKSVVEI
ncbi:AraC family transcriptional regulator [Neobacillus cucumis]|uniref:AraC family transcriptional regulator n=1 Tax=Neobacillus cucumis TaxID=1740721 RepID=UPI002853616D|nr:AraC family transcriptional regulator [Neobacillus cucumis]MDR4948018.1 AraC family transcriptional regulator [Neobacillus cucumis]